MQAVNLTPSQQSSPNCRHTAQALEVTPGADGCEACLAIGDVWVHLRVCLNCGHVGCCDASKNKHATDPFHTTRHPVVRSFELGETWAYGYEEGVLL